MGSRRYAALLWERTWKTTVVQAVRIVILSQTIALRKASAAETECY